MILRYGRMNTVQSIVVMEDQQPIHLHFPISHLQSFSSLEHVNTFSAPFETVICME